MLRTPVRAIAIAAVGLALAGCSTDIPTSPVEQDTTLPTVEATDAATPAAEPAGNTDAALDEYAALEQSQIDMLLETSAGMFSDISIEPAYPNEMVYTYTYAEALDPDVAAAAFEETVDTLQQIVDGQLFPLMETTGVTGPKKATYVYLNPDGTELWSHTFES